MDLTVEPFHADFDAPSGVSNFLRRHEPHDAGVFRKEEVHNLIGDPHIGETARSVPFMPLPPTVSGELLLP